MSLLSDVVLGLYLGAVTGVFPALVAWVLAFTFRYVIGVTLPAFAVVVLGVAIAGIQGGLLGLLDANVVQSPAALIALIIVMMATMYTHSRGDQMGATFPRRITLKRLRESSLSGDVIERVGGFGRVTIRPAGDVADVEGYPPLPDDLRRTIANGEWAFPADLSLSELERRLADRLTTEFDLAEAFVDVDPNGRASIAAAPAPGGLSRRIPDGKRAVSVETLVPTGMARGEEVRVDLPERSVEGTVVGAPSEPTPVPAPVEEADGDATATPTVEPDAGEPSRPVDRAPTSRGGDGRVTLAVSRDDATALLGVDSSRLVVRSRGTRREFELVSLLRSAGNRFRTLVVRDGASLAGSTIGDADVRDAYGVVVLASRNASGWSVAPRGDATLDAGDELVVVGPTAALDAFEEAVA